MTNQIAIPVFLLRLIVALVLGALIGIERAWHHRMAGPRTNALVSSGSAAFFMMGAVIGGDGAADIPFSATAEQLVARLLCNDSVIGASWRCIGTIANDV